MSSSFNKLSMFVLIAMHQCTLPAISDIHRSSVHENVLAPFDFVYVS